jgi:hypothetical protein
VLTLQSVSSDGRTLTFREALQFTHYGRARPPAAVAATAAPPLRLAAIQEACVRS